ncbi:MAG: VWA domain-containing protein [Opitutus sp.]|nr:VWA domain-containing protein [Opitutus sp.]
MLGGVPGAFAAPASALVGIALAVILDTSGSMRRPIAGSPGRADDVKFRIAQRALLKVITRLETFAKNPSSPPLSISTYVFSGQEAVRALPLAPFNAASARQWLAAMKSPEAATPLGDALALAGRDLLAVNAISRHMLVLTDGANTAGRNPITALVELNATAGKKKTPVGVHVVTLDLNPQIFSGLKAQGATLIGATNEAELNARFDFILEQKILLEAP